jgi:hopanoid C-2 methylase
MMQTRKARVLIVLAHFDETRNPQGRPDFVPQGMGHAFLAGAFNRNMVQVRIYSEFYHGPLVDEAAFAWPDMLVLTGVTSAFDRMRQLTAYVRTKAPHCVVVAGGPAVRNLPLSSAQVFDYACHGDVEELQLIAHEVFGEWAVSDRVLPRFDLLNWGSPVNYIETSRYCNFKCTFCALTAEGRSYRTYDHEYIESQIRSAPRNKYVLFIDNNFYGNNRDVFLSKLELIKSLWREGLFKGWLALVTWDFFKDSRNLDAVRESGCLGLFSGVESLSEVQLRRYQKRQNLVVPQLNAIRACLEAGVVFQYGLIFDPSTQSLREMREELAFVTRESSVPLPAFLSLAIPLLGTPLFYERAADKRFLPSAKLRDMDGFTLLTHPLDPMADVARFARGLAQLDGYQHRILRHCLGFYFTYRRSLSGRQMANLLANSLRLVLPSVMHSRRFPRRQAAKDRLTYVTTTQPLGPLYTPLFRLPGGLRGHFSPTMITDSSGCLDEDLAGNLEARRAQQTSIGAERGV